MAEAVSETIQCVKCGRAWTRQQLGIDWPPGALPMWVCPRCRAHWTPEDKEKRPRAEK